MHYVSEFWKLTSGAEIDGPRDVASDSLRLDQHLTLNKVRVQRHNLRR